MPKNIKKFQKTKMKTKVIKIILWTKLCSTKIISNSTFRKMKVKKFTAKLKKCWIPRHNKKLEIICNLVRQNSLQEIQLEEELIT